uniref:Uncharacterized protein At2g06040 n=1 Tax=Arabidopsis thaliana TaxID=3702 RepID=Q9ZQ00_ARATH|nr:hypothetical protein [Arabidopsis thaliana]
MTILRSREIPSVSPKPLPKESDTEPSTPARTLEPELHRSPDETAPELGLVDEPTHTTRRRSLRLAHQFDGDDCVTEKEVSVDEKFLSLRSGKRVAKRGVDYGIEIESSKFDFDLKLGESASKTKRVCVDLVEETIVKNESEDSVDLEDKSSSGVLGDSLAEKWYVVEVENESNNKGKGIMEDSYGESDVICGQSYEKQSSSMGRRRYTREEKGKGIMQVEDVSSPVTVEIVEVDEEEMEIESLVNSEKPPDVSVTELAATMANVEQAQNRENSNEIGNDSRTQHFRDIAERIAHRFAHFDAQVEEEEDLSDKEGEQQVEDWPGPFSTAMKIIKDREEYTTPHVGIGVSNKERSSPTIWVPRSNFSFPPRKAPSLQELSLRVLVKNADAITSLDYVPDTLRVKLCQLLCDSRRMDLHFLDLLVQGSPTEICVPDCSWLTEEEFTECFKNCDTSNLMVTYFFL